jgi:AhpD family alkylhydroperoxidase
MDTHNQEQIERIQRNRKRGQAELSKKSDVHRAFLEIEHKAFAEGAVPKMYKELMATAISVVTDCESCMEWHIDQALKAGATEEQVVEAIGVGIEMGIGPATVSARFAMNVLEYHSKAADCPRLIPPQSRGSGSGPHRPAA